MGKFSLNKIANLNHKITLANSFTIFMRPSIRRQSLSYESFGGLLNQMNIKRLRKLEGLDLGKQPIILSLYF